MILSRFRIGLLWLLVGSIPVFGFYYQMKERALVASPRALRGKWSSAAHKPSTMPFRLMSDYQIQKVLRNKMKGLSHQDVQGLSRHIMKECDRRRVRPSLVLALIQAESSFRPEIVSYAGAVGLMQIMPDTAEFISREWGIVYEGREHLSDPFINISLGVTYLAYLKKKYQNRMPRVLAAYNIGPGRVDQLLAANRFRIKQTKPYIDSILHGSLVMREVGYEGSDWKWRSYGVRSLQAGWSHRSP